MRRTWRRHGVVLAGLLVIAGRPADLRADTTLNRGTTTVSSGTNVGSNLYVGTTGTADAGVISGTGGFGADAWVTDWTPVATPDSQRLVFFQSTGTLMVVPEPATAWMALAGLAFGSFSVWRRRRRA